MSNTKEKLMHGVFFAIALTSILLVMLICLFLVVNSVPALSKIGLVNFITGKDWSPNDLPPSFGLLPMIVGSIYITIGAIIVGVPIGVLTAVFMAKFCPQKIYRPIKISIDLLAGIPSIVYGFFGMVLLVPFIRETFGGNGSSILTASILLGIMILPTVVAISETAIRAVPESYYEGSLALGISRERSIFFVMLPAAKSGILAAIVLGIGRAIGETMAVIMVAGNQARMPNDILSGARSLTANIVLEMGYAAELHREALIATGLVLFVLILIINFSFSALARRESL